MVVGKRPRGMALKRLIPQQLLTCLTALNCFKAARPEFSRPNADISLGGVKVRALFETGSGVTLCNSVLSRRAQSAAGFFRRESEDLRDLNARLSREITERKKVQETLAVAEQSLVQSQKLAALGEMSAAVSHELNQPLAAMKTYLAGAKLLLDRKRPEEAQSSFQRIDDLIERMGAITKQLKSYARKGGDELLEVDLRDAVSGSLSMMEPQLKKGDIKLVVSLPDQPVKVIGDRVRLEQVIINLFRNALDATKSQDRPEVQILLNAGETATLTLRDNGEGIENLEELFEPFYTTKQPGEGVGLGLAISSSIVSELGGSLTARNGQSGGAVFEMQLPLAKTRERTALDMGAETGVVKAAE